MRAHLDDFGTGYSSLTFLRHFARQHAEDRPLVRRGDLRRRRQRRDRAHDHRPRRQPRPRRDRRGGREPQSSSASSTSWAAASPRATCSRGPVDRTSIEALLASWEPERVAPACALELKPIGAPSGRGHTETEREGTPGRAPRPAARGARRSRSACSSTGSSRSCGVDYELEPGLVVFTEPIHKEGEIRGIRRLTLLLGRNRRLPQARGRRRRVHARRGDEVRLGPRDPARRRLSALLSPTPDDPKPPSPRALGAELGRPRPGPRRRPRRPPAGRSGRRARSRTAARGRC